MTEPLWDTPQHWKWLTAADVGKIVGGGTPATSDPTNFAENEIPWITPADLTGYKAKYISRGSRDISKKGYQSSGAQLLPAGTVLFSSRAPIGYCVIAANEISTNQGFKSIIPRPEHSSEYLRYYLLSAKEYAESLASGTTFKELSGARMANVAIPAPPLSEQRHIAAKLDGLTGKTARAREELTRIPRLIHHYRHSILSAAFEGELTSEWRLTQGLPTPKTTTLGAVVSDVRYGTAKKCSIEPRGTAVLRIPNVAEGSIDLSELKYAPLEPKELAKLRLEQGDVLVVRSNGSVDLIGRPALVTSEAVGMAFAGYLIRLRPELSVIEPRFLVAMLQSPQIRNVIETGARSTSGVHNINSGELEALEIPQPELAEQREIVRRVETAFAWLDRVAAEHANASRLLPKLDQAILAKAFRGDLVQLDDRR